MITVPVLSKTEAITHVISVMTEEFSIYYDTVFFETIEELQAYAQKNIPELILLDLTDPTNDGETFLSWIKEQKPLEFSSIVAIVQNDGDRMALEMEPNKNLMLSLTERDFLRNCTRLFKIIKQNIQFLFNRNILIDLKVQESGIFICDNDSFDIIVYTNLLTTYLAETGRIGFDTKFQLQTALMEMLLNALEHGNCNINYDEKTQWLESGRDILELIEERNKDPAIAAKKIILSYDIDVTETHFSIKDEGEGFDWQDMLQRDIEPNLHGMGIKMTESMVKSLAYNDKGNEVFFSIMNEPGSVNPERIPFKIKWYKEKAVIKKASEPSDSIYFLLNGSVSVSHYRQVVGHYVPADILIGYSNPFSSEPFSGTMKAVDEAKVIKISKQDFKKFLEQYPSFRVFTERLKTRTYSAANPI